MIELNKFFPWSQQLRQNYEILQREVQKLGLEYEQKSYEELLRPAEENFRVKMIDDRQITFSAEAYDRLKDGTISFCIDVDGLPTLWGIKPSYHFYKRPDGSVYY
jgi:hypothetical protein